MRDGLTERTFQLRLIALYVDELPGRGPVGERRPQSMQVRGQGNSRLR
jgi:hypothetical protein